MYCGVAHRNSLLVYISSNPFVAIKTLNSGLSSGFFNAKSSKYVHVTIPWPPFCVINELLLALFWLLNPFPDY